MFSIENISNRLNLQPQKDTDPKEVPLEEPVEALEETEPLEIPYSPFETEESIKALKANKPSRAQELKAIAKQRKDSLALRKAKSLKKAFIQHCLENHIDYNKI